MGGEAPKDDESSSEGTSTTVETGDQQVTVENGGETGESGETNTEDTADGEAAAESGDDTE